MLGVLLQVTISCESLRTNGSLGENLSLNHKILINLSFGIFYRNFSCVDCIAIIKNLVINLDIISSTFIVQEKS